MMQSIPVQWLWNIKAPAVFGLNTIPVWQLLRLLILASILFSSASPGGCRRRWSDVRFPAYARFDAV